jgi:diaminobutyrate-2-oxoglutarate transaminase
MSTAGSQSEGAGAVAGERGAELLARQGERESSARSYPRRLPIAIASASGVHVRDVDGREFIDCLAGAGTLALGHNHPVVVEAVRDAIDAETPWTTLDLTTPLKDAFVEELMATLPPELGNGRIQFCGPTGADGVEAAMKLCRHATGRGGIMAFGGGYHGVTQGTLSLTGDRASKERLGALLPDIHHVPFPLGYRPAFGPGTDEAEMCARVLRWALEDDHSGIVPPAALVMEPVQGEGGVHPAPASFAAQVRELCTRAGVPLVLDEVQTGLGRTGTVWGMEALGIVPDAVVLSKAIGGGLPLAVVVYREELDVWGPGAHAGTFRGNQLAMAAGAATIREVVGSGLAERASALGARLVDGLRDAAAGVEEVGDVRGRGLMVGAEVVDPAAPDADGVPAASGALARAVQREMFARGVICEVGGRADAVVRFLPPLIITEEQVDQVVEVFGAALAAALADR